MKAKSCNSKVSQPTSKCSEDYGSLIPKWFLGIAIVMFLIYYRSPSLFIEPRFWAEEGQGYFTYAFSHSIFGSLIAPHYGYFGFIPNLGGILATFAPLELAPLVTTCLAALIQLLVSSYVIFCDSPYWDSYPKKLAIACFIQLLCPFECWLTTVSSQYFLSILAFFILMENDTVQMSWLKWPSRIMLSVSVLTSPAVMFLLPAFIFKSFKTRLREDWLRIIIISFGAVIQVTAFVYTSFNASGQLGGRFDSSSFNLLKIIFLHFSESMIGSYYLMWFKFFGLAPGIVRIVLTLFTLYLLCLLIKSFFCKQLHLLGIAFVLLTVPVILLSIGMKSSPRAAFAPAILLIVLMVYECGKKQNKLFLRGIAACVLSAVLLFGLLTHDMKVYFTNSPLPVWKDEVGLWRQDSNYKPKIWPSWKTGIKLDSKK